jgi:hypothetical protein
MTARASMALVAIVTIAAGCDRTETTTAAEIKTTTPAGTSTAPSPADAKHRDEALVRVVHAAPGGQQLDLFAGDLVLFDGLGFKSVTPYRAIDGKRYSFALRPAGMTQAKALSTNTEGLRDGSFYTAFAMPGDGHGPTLRIVSDHLDEPAAGKAQLRIVHAGVNAGEIDVRDGGNGQTLFDGVDFESVTDYREITPVNGAIEIVSNNEGSPVLTSFNAHLDAGRFYTVLIVGSATGTPKLEAFLIEDALSP